MLIVISWRKVRVAMFRVIELMSPLLNGPSHILPWAEGERRHVSRN